MRLWDDGKIWPRKDSTTSVLGTWLLYDLPDELMLEPPALCL